MKILLVNPPSGDLTVGLKHLSKVEPLGLEIIGGAVPDHEVELLDMELDTDLLAALRRFQPDIVGASAQIVQTYTARRVLKTSKEFDPQILTLLGGHHATLCPQEFNAAYIDAIVLGEGVSAFREIVESWRQDRTKLFEHILGLAIPRDGELHFTPPRPIPRNLDHHPLPNRSLTDKYRSQYFYLFEDSVASIQTSMGCTFPCNFCSCREFTQRRYVARSPELILDDLKTIKKDFIIFCDDHSFIDVDRMGRLHELIVESGIQKRYFAYTRSDCVVQNPEIFRKWAKIGLVMVMTGLEAIDDSGIEKVEKRTSVDMNEQAIEILRECGIGLSAGFLIMPDFMADDFKRIDAYVRARPNIVLTELTPLTPLPGTPLYAEQQENILSDHRELYDLAHFVVPTKLPQAKMYGLIRKYYIQALWRAIIRLGLYRPQYLFKRHFPRLLMGALRNGRLIKQMYKSAAVPVPQEI